MKLTDEYKRTTEQFKDLQGKFRLFEQVDTKKYADVWAMKEEEVATIVKQLLQADKVSLARLDSGQSLCISLITGAFCGSRQHG